jgi:uncharacterized damage-inducible protein DinB
VGLIAQDADASVAALKQAYNAGKGKILAGAEAMPEADYGLTPGMGSRTFGEVVGHIADAQGAFCGAVAGTPTQLNAEKGMKAKADLVGALRKSFDVCDTAYNGTTAANHDAETKGPFGPPSPRNALLWNNVAHSEEMYGTMGVYLRIKGIVPPSTAGKGKGKGGGGKK